MHLQPGGQVRKPSLGQGGHGVEQGDAFSLDPPEDPLGAKVIQALGQTERTTTG